MNHATLLLIKFAAALIAFGIGLDLFLMQPSETLFLLAC